MIPVDDQSYLIAKDGTRFRTVKRVGLYFMLHKTDSLNVCVMDLKYWYSAMAYCNFQHLKKLMNHGKGMKISNTPVEEDCDICKQGKMSLLPVEKGKWRAEKPLHFVHRHCGNNYPHHVCMVINMKFVSSMTIQE